MPTAATAKITLAAVCGIASFCRLQINSAVPGMDKTFLKGLVLLETLARSNDSCGVTELAGTLGLNKSNVHRLLQGLVHQGFARKVGTTGRYELTIKMWELGSRVFGRLDVRRVAQGFMETLAQDTAETVHLSVLDGTEVVYVAKIDSPQPVRAYSTVGGRAPAQCVATGKAQLAWASPEKIGEIKQSLRAYSSNSILSADELDAELSRIRAQGYALNRGEWREQVCGVAAPIRDVSGEVVAAIGISGPSERLKPRRMKELSPFLINAADRISEQLGCESRA
jgi:DNA-binding IclR family transcriptional regulator